MEKKKVFEDDFFKSNELNEQGHLLQKSIPTVGSKPKKVEKKKKEVSKEVKAFKQKVETAFETINEVVKDLVDLCGKKPENCAEMLSEYRKFKSSFEWKLNDAINYPGSLENDHGISHTGSESRVNI